MRAGKKFHCSIQDELLKNPKFVYTEKEKSYECINKPKLSIIQNRYAGEYCEIDSQCLTHDEKEAVRCINQRSDGKREGEEAVNQYQCLPGTWGLPNENGRLICTALKVRDASCETTFECQHLFGCMDKKCVQFETFPRMVTLENLTLVDLELVH